MLDYGLLVVSDEDNADSIGPSCILVWSERLVNLATNPGKTEMRKKLPLTCKFTVMSFASVCLHLELALEKFWCFDPAKR